MPDLYKVLWFITCQCVYNGNMLICEIEGWLQLITYRKPPNVNPYGYVTDDDSFRMQAIFSVIHSYTF